TRRSSDLLHAFLTHEGWACKRGRLLTEEGRRWAAALALAPSARAQVDTLIRIIVLLEQELAPLERELRAFARSDPRTVALQTIFGVGPILACHLLAELGEAKRFRRARQAVRAAGLDPVVSESAESKRSDRPPEAAPTVANDMRDTKAPPHGEICRALLPSPGTRRAAQTGVSRRRRPNQTSRAATARAKIGTGRPPRTNSNRPPPRVDVS